MGNGLKENVELDEIYEYKIEKILSIKDLKKHLLDAIAEERVTDDQCDLLEAIADNMVLKLPKDSDIAKLDLKSLGKMEREDADGLIFNAIEKLDNAFFVLIAIPVPSDIVKEGEHYTYLTYSYGYCQLKWFYVTDINTELDSFYLEEHKNMLESVYQQEQAA